MNTKGICNNLKYVISHSEIILSPNDNYTIAFERMQQVQQNNK